MPVQIPDLKGKVAAVLLLAVAMIFCSCATKKDVTLIQDPDQKEDSIMPWNKQEKWESAGQMGNMTDRR